MLDARTISLQIVVYGRRHAKIKKYIDLGINSQNKILYLLLLPKTSWVYIFFVSQHATSKTQEDGSILEISQIGGSGAEGSSKLQKKAVFFFFSDLVTNIMIS